MGVVLRLTWSAHLTGSLTTVGSQSTSPAPPCQQNDGTESDSGISDTNHDSDQESNCGHEDKEKSGDDGDMEVDMECETILTNLADPTEVLGLEAIVGLTQPPEDQEDMLAYTAGQDAL